MSKQIEKEFKYLIDIEQFQSLLLNCQARYTFIKQKVQANYYYDTDSNALNKAKTTVRIRQQYSDMELQIKKHLKSEDGLTTSDEYIEKIDILPVSLRIPDMNDILVLKGVLVTTRTMFSLGKNSTICFDSNLYLGICDYELEFEVDEADVDLALMVMEELDLSSKSFLNKSERFFERLDAMKNG